MRMTNRALGWGSWVVPVLAGWILYAPALRAEESCDGRPCPEGFTCVTTSTTCPSDDPGCEVFTETYCKSPECETDADCPAGRRCRVETISDCGAPAQGSGGGSAAPAECTERRDSWCHMAYDLECETSEQCGPGFTCEPLVDCDCSNPEAPVPPDCACEYTKIKGCYSPVVPCSVHGDCASGWSCVENTEGICNFVGDFHGGCNPGEPPMACIPPGFSVATPATADPGGPPEDLPGDTRDASATSGDTAGGCSFAPASSSEAGLLLGGLSLLLALARRRRS
jgi:hypothetical protein